MYYNTLNNTGEVLKSKWKKTDTQDAIICSIYEVYNNPLSPSQIKDIVSRDGIQWPLTSVRRSINTLTRRGYLTKMKDKVTGIYGHDEHLWKYSREAA